MAEPRDAPHSSRRPPIIETPTSHDAWSDFWRTSRQGAIDLHANDPLASALREHWHAQIPWITACNAVVDVGSGPAVLPRLLLSLQAPILERVRWTCIDGARVPRWPDMPATVRMMDGVDFGATSAPPGEPLPGALVSNFGIEYIDPEVFAAGCARWLASGGRLHAVAHLSGSVIDQVSAAAADDIGWALDDVGLFDAASGLVVAMESLPADQAARAMHGANERQTYNTAVNRVKQRMEDRKAPSAALMDMLVSLRALIQEALGGQRDVAREALWMQRDLLRGEITRLQAMQRSALDVERLQALTDALARVGITLESPSTINCVMGTVACVLSGRRV